MIVLHLHATRLFTVLKLEKALKLFTGPNMSKIMVSTSAFLYSTWPMFHSGSWDFLEKEN